MNQSVTPPRPVGRPRKVVAETQPLLRTTPSVRSVDWLTPAFGAADGYGKSAEQMALELERQSVRVQLVGLVRPAGNVTARNIFQRRPIGAGDAIVFYSQPTSWMPQSGRKSYGFTMYEADPLPDLWRPYFSRVDEIWVPSKWLVDVFARASGRAVHHIPLGVDAAAFHGKLRTRGKTLRFLHFTTLGSETRKGVDLAIAAFRAAFGNRDDVSLTLRSSIPYRATDVVDHRIRHHNGPMTPAQLTELYHEHDALLYPSRGEGFGLIPLEAMATGMPSIFADASGMADYASLGLSVPAIPARAQVGVGRSTGLATSAAERSTWFEPDLAALVDRLREVDRDYDRVAAEAYANAATIADEWSWQRTGAAILERLKA